MGGPPAGIPALLARLAVRRPTILVAAALAIAAAAAFIFQSRQAFDSEILNLLPAGERSVEGLKIFNSRFNSARELAFLVEGDSAGAEEFVAELVRQPWVLRVLDAAPTESAAGRETLPFLAAPLILAQADAEFDATLARLDPEGLGERLKSLSARAAAGSPVAQIELANDPTGTIAPVAAALSKKLSIAEAFDMGTGNARVVPAITNQPTLSADDCRDLMRSVRRFLENFQSRPGAPRVSVTGRSAYVAEIAGSMQRDIAITSLVSIAAVTVLFWFAFRSLVPLAGSVLILVWSCLIALAAGSLVFDKLNVVAMGFCSILLGLGDDFSLLLYQRYVGARRLGHGREAAIADSIRHGAPGILWVALTTGLGFATLAFSGSSGFAQLGVLIAIGVAAGALGMIFFMPVFERGVPAGGRDPVLAACSLALKSRVTPAAAALVFFAAVVLAAVPWRALEFDTSPHSLEPREIPAARALARIMELFPATFEPVMVVVPGPADPSALVRLDTVLDGLKSRGAIAKFSSPSSLVADPAQVARNVAKIRALDLSGLRRSMAAAADSAGLRPEVLAPATRLLDGLGSSGSLADRLPASSPWWFVLDRMLAPESGDVIYYVQLAPGADRNSRMLVEAAVAGAVPAALVTGWSQTLNDMVPWATRELVVFGSSVVGIILLVLIFIYRDIRLIGLHAAALALAMCGTVATLKLSGRPINLLNVLAFPLILAVGVDYGVHLLLVVREPGNLIENLPGVMKPVLISALTTITGFGALVFARNPALNGLGFVCATGVAWCLAASVFLLAPLLPRLRDRIRPDGLDKAGPPWAWWRAWENPRC